jgi:hypothetical protein
MKRSAFELAEVALRLVTEKLIPIETISREMHISRDSVRRWIMRGKNGIFLDGIEQVDEGWLTSREALARFQRAKTAAESAIQVEPSQRTKRPQEEKAGPGRDRRGILEGIRRIVADGLVSVSTLSNDSGIDECNLIAWVRTGVNGCFMDGINKGQAGWFSSFAAIERFAMALSTAGQLVVESQK